MNYVWLAVMSRFSILTSTKLDISVDFIRRSALHLLRNKFVNWNAWSFLALLQVSRDMGIGALRNLLWTKSLLIGICFPLILVKLKSDNLVNKPLTLTSEYKLCLFKIVLISVIWISGDWTSPWQLYCYHLLKYHSELVITRVL